MKLQYDPTTLRRIRAEMKNKYEITNIDVATRTWIIILGICKQISHGPYWRSKWVQDYSIGYPQSIDPIFHQHKWDNWITIDLELPCIKQ